MQNSKHYLLSIHYFTHTRTTKLQKLKIDVFLGVKKIPLFLELLQLAYFSHFFLEIGVNVHNVTTFCILSPFLDICEHFLQKHVWL